LALIVSGDGRQQGTTSGQTKKFWRMHGVRLTVSFLDNPSRELLSHMNAWSKTANMQFTETASGGRSADCP
jgi:hypothetical protein